MGGVLVRTEDRTQRERLAQRVGMTSIELFRLVFDSATATKATLGEVPVEAVWQNVAERLNLTTTGLAEFIQEFWAGDYSDADLYQFIQGLREKYKTGLLSNAWSDARANIDSSYHLLDAFDVVIFSAEVGLAKPDPRIYQLMLDKLGVQAAEAIFIDDFQENIDAANALGIHGVHFENSLQARQAVRQILWDNSHS
jgi:epoxide hydrolase-like predicted phosphatase